MAQMSPILAPRVINDPFRDLFTDIFPGTVVMGPPLGATMTPLMRSSATMTPAPR